MKQFSLLLLIVCMVCVSCNKDDEEKDDPQPTLPSEITINYPGDYMAALGEIREWVFTSDLEGELIDVEEVTGESLKLDIGSPGAKCMLSFARLENNFYDFLIVETATVDGQYVWEAPVPESPAIGEMSIDFSSPLYAEIGYFMGASTQESTKRTIKVDPEPGISSRVSKEMKYPSSDLFLRYSNTDPVSGEVRFNFAKKEQVTCEQTVTEAELEFVEGDFYNIAFPENESVSITIDGLSDFQNIHAGSYPWLFNASLSPEIGKPIQLLPNDWFSDYLSTITVYTEGEPFNGTSFCNVHKGDIPLDFSVLDCDFGDVQDIPGGVGFAVQGEVDFADVTYLGNNEAYTFCCYWAIDVPVVNQKATFIRPQLPTSVNEVCQEEMPDMKLAIRSIGDYEGVNNYKDMLDVYAKDRVLLNSYSSYRSKMVESLFAKNIPDYLLSHRKRNGLSPAF